MTLTSADLAARDALRARQGAGARYDAVEAPGDDLLLARRATSYFARKLGELDDDVFYRPSTLGKEWSRAHVVASVGYDARRQALMLEPMTNGQPVLPPEALAEELPPLDLAVTLPARALRYLFDHSAIHLDVCWRDLPGAAWGQPINDGTARQLLTRDLPRLRAITLWRLSLIHI